MADLIAGVDVVTVRAPLSQTIRFGPWVMEHREFILCRLRTEAGREGFGFVYTRDAPLAAVVRRNIAPMYVGRWPRPSLPPLRSARTRYEPSGRPEKRNAPP